MSNDYGSESVKCPFYDKESKRTIRCEDFIGETCERTFKSIKAKRIHKAKYCDSLKDCHDCPHHKQVDKKYD